MSLIDHIKRIKAIADLGILYGNTDYDLERYRELRQISIEMLGEIIHIPVHEIEKFYAPVTEYPTAKVDVRALVLNDKGQVLLVKEVSDGCWSLPGGWADIGFSPAEVAVNEVEEETGLHVECNQLLAVFDKKCHPHPPQAFYVYKLIFHCVILDENIDKGFDILDTGFFDMDHLPPLSVNRILKSQIETVYKRLMSGEKATIFD
jgi:ADP-ribose pyrophosphatase YjhB (NUDIX family)